MRTSIASSADVSQASASMRRLRRLARAGFSMIEVMVSLAILSIATTSVVGWLSINRQLEVRTLELQQMHILASTIVSRLDAMSSFDLGTTDMAPWTMARWTDGDGEAPLQVNATKSTDDLKLQGLISAPLSVTNARVYIEYFVGCRDASNVSVVGVNGSITTGILNIISPSGSSTAGDATAATFKNTIAANRGVGNSLRLNATDAPKLQLLSNDVLLIRVLLTWGPRTVTAAYTDLRPEESIELYTAKRME